ncbi:unnamed protein product [Amoebophrya sp. A120]|nr:unnamed protein product [Amoebophrya sp. A120]|eukprot:GSA120T00002249001.1
MIPSPTQHPGPAAYGTRRGAFMFTQGHQLGKPHLSPGVDEEDLAAAVPDRTTGTSSTREDLGRGLAGGEIEDDKILKIYRPRPGATDTQGGEQHAESVLMTPKKSYSPSDANCTIAAVEKDDSRDFAPIPASATTASVLLQSKLKSSEELCERARAAIQASRQHLQRLSTQQYPGTPTGRKPHSYTTPSSRSASPKKQKSAVGGELDKKEQPIETEAGEVEVLDGDGGSSKREVVYGGNTEGDENAGRPIPMERGQVLSSETENASAAARGPEPDTVVDQAAFCSQVSRSVSSTSIGYRKKRDQAPGGAVAATSSRAQRTTSKGFTLFYPPSRTLSRQAHGSTSRPISSARIAGPRPSSGALAINRPRTAITTNVSHQVVDFRSPLLKKIDKPVRIPVDAAGFGDTSIKVPPFVPSRAASAQVRPPSQNGWVVPQIAASPAVHIPPQFAWPQTEAAAAQRTINTTNAWSNAYSRDATGQSSTSLLRQQDEHVELVPASSGKTSEIGDAEAADSSCRQSKNANGPLDGAGRDRKQESQHYRRPQSPTTCSHGGSKSSLARKSEFPLLRFASPPLKRSFDRTVATLQRRASLKDLQDAIRTNSTRGTSVLSKAALHGAGSSTARACTKEVSTSSSGSSRLFQHTSKNASSNHPWTTLSPRPLRAPFSTLKIQAPMSASAVFSAAASGASSKGSSGDTGAGAPAASGTILLTTTSTTASSASAGTTTRPKGRPADKMKPVDKNHGESPSATSNPHDPFVAHRTGKPQPQTKVVVAEMKPASVKQVAHQQPAASSSSRFNTKNHVSPISTNQAPSRGSVVTTMLYPEHTNSTSSGAQEETGALRAKPVQAPQVAAGLGVVLAVDHADPNGVSGKDGTQTVGDDPRVEQFLDSLQLDSLDLPPEKIAALTARSRKAFQNDVAAQRVSNQGVLMKRSKSEVTKQVGSTSNRASATGETTCNRNRGAKTKPKARVRVPISAGTVPAQPQPPKQIAQKNRAATTTQTSPRGPAVRAADAALPHRKPRVPTTRTVSLGTTANPELGQEPRIPRKGNSRSKTEEKSDDRAVVVTSQSHQDSVSKRSVVAATTGGSKTAREDGSSGTNKVEVSRNADSADLMLQEREAVMIEQQQPWQSSGTGAGGARSPAHTRLNKQAASTIQDLKQSVLATLRHTTNPQGEDLNFLSETLEKAIAVVEAQKPKGSNCSDLVELLAKRACNFTHKENWSDNAASPSSSSAATCPEGGLTSAQLQPVTLCRKTMRIFVHCIYHISSEVLRSSIFEAVISMVENCSVRGDPLVDQQAMLVFANGLKAGRIRIGLFSRAVRLAVQRVGPCREVCFFLTEAATRYGKEYGQICLRLGCFRLLQQVPEEYHAERDVARDAITVAVQDSVNVNAVLFPNADQ